MSIAAPTTELSIAGIDFAKILEIAKNIPDPNPPSKVASQTTIDEERVSYSNNLYYFYTFDFRRIMLLFLKNHQSLIHRRLIELIHQNQSKIINQSQLLAEQHMTMTLMIQNCRGLNSMNKPAKQGISRDGKAFFINPLFRIESLVKRLYSGMPCTACGLRFLQSQTTRYADHLDFHYRNVLI